MAQPLRQHEMPGWAVTTPDGPGTAKWRQTAAAVIAATLLVMLALAWIGLRAAVRGDAAPVISDPGFRQGLTVDPLPHSLSSLQPSDVVVAVDGAPINRWLSGEARRADLTSVLTYRVRRDGRSLSVLVATNRRDVTSARLRAAGGVLLCSIAVLGLGGYTVYRRRDASAARCLLLLGAGLLTYATFVTFGYDTSDLVNHRLLFEMGFAGSTATLVFWAMAASYLALTFPQPLRTVQRHRRIWLGAYAAVLVGVSVAASVIATSPTASLERLNTMTSATSDVVTVLALLTVAGLTHTLWRAWRDPSLRSQCLIVVLGFAATAGGLLVANLVAGTKTWPAWLDVVLLLPLPLAVTAAILRGEFLGIRAVLNRTLVYTTLTGLLVAIYAAAVTAVGAVLGHVGVAPELVATAAVAIGFAPLRAGLQRVVDKVLYGARGDRSAVLRAVGEQLEAALDPGDVLPAIVETVASALHLPYVAVRTQSNDGTRLAAERGERCEEVHVLPLIHHGIQVGDLVVAARRGEKTISAADASVLADVARQVAPAVRAAWLVTDLAASHNRLAVTREEERARLRHDLHDRLGPHLVGLSLQLDSISGQMEGPRSSQAVARAHAEATLALDEVRRISRGLRPAELEELGLVQAINAAARRLSIADDETAWQVSVDAALQLGTIPPDVESAAYQIALEGLTNAYRHSGGRAAVVRVGVDASGRALIVEVSDDGWGLNGSAKPGVGIGSMHARAEALGGTVTIRRPDAGGTVVRARLPLG